MADSFTKKIIDGGVWSMALSVISIVAQVLAVLVLSRIFTPEEFGQVALAIMLLEFFKSLTFPFIVRAIILKDKLTPTFVGSSRFVAVVHGILAIGVFFAIRPILEGFFDKSGISDYAFYYVIVGVVLTCIYMPLKAVLEKEIRIKEIQKGEIVITVAATIIQVITAIIYPHELVLFLSLIIILLGRTFYFLAKSKFITSISWPDIRSIYKSSVEIVLGDMANVLALQGDNMIISRYMDLASLGIYSRAYKLMKIPTNLLSNVFNQVAFPSFALMDLSQLRKVYSKLIFLISFILFPIIAVIILFYKEIVWIILGPKWEMVEIPFLILGVGIYLRLIYKVPTTVLKARDKFRSLMTGQVLYAFLIVAFAFSLKSFGVPGVALATVISLALYNIYLLFIINKEFKLPISEYAKVFVRPMLVFAIAVAVLLLFKSTLGMIVSNSIVVFAISTLLFISMVFVMFQKNKEMLLGSDGMWWYRTLIERKKA